VKHAARAQQGLLSFFSREKPIRPVPCHGSIAGLMGGTRGRVRRGRQARAVRVGQHLAVTADSWGWPERDEDLVELQGRLATAATSALATDPWLPGSERPVLGGCFVAYARGDTGPGQPGDRAWAAAVAWRGDPADRGTRSSDRHLRGTTTPGYPRQADDVLTQSIVTARVPSSYVPGLLASREGPILATALASLDLRP
jgi:hypothetical protein